MSKNVFNFFQPETLSSAKCSQCINKPTFPSFFLEIESAINLTLPARVNPSKSPFLTSPLNSRISYVPQSSPNSSRDSPTATDQPANRADRGQTNTFNCFRPWLSDEDKKRDGERSNINETNSSGKY